MTSPLLYRDEVYKIVGAAMEVYNQLGAGFQEPVYHEALEIELRSRTIQFESHRELEIFYKGQRLKKTYEADFIVFSKIIVEIKALDRLTSREQAQLLNYLKATGLKVGILVNFGSDKNLEWKRMILTDEERLGVIESTR